MKGSPIHQYFDILKSFCNFWPLEMAPTWAVPGLCFQKTMIDDDNRILMNKEILFSDDIDRRNESCAV